MKSSKRSSNLSIFFSALLRTGYFPAEIPPTLTPKYFAEYCKGRYATLKSEQKRLIKLSTSYDTFTAPRARGGRRNLALVHPLAQIGISLLISKHRAKIKEIISRSGHSLYRVTEDMTNFKAFESLDFRKRDVLTPRIYADCPFVLRADISRFFYTAYTHSIPWAIIGKSKVKDWLLNDRRKLSNHWSNELDMALQSCQSRETFGIPVGPDTSRVIAEILLAGVESDVAVASCIQSRPKIRLLDDFVIGFENESSANKALQLLRKSLWKYNLQLNDSKTSVDRSCTLYRERWKIEFDRFGISESDAPRQSRDIYNLVDLTLAYCQEFGTGAPANWACRRLSEIRRNVDNFQIIVEVMLRLARDFPACIPHVAAFLVNNQHRCQSIELKQQVATWIRWALRAHSPNSHDAEIAWCLLLCGVLRIPVGRADLEPVEQRPSSVVMVMLGLLRERGLLSIPLSTWNWRAEFKSSGAYGQNWLVAYEATRRKWTNDKSIIGAVRREKILADMLVHNVSFVEEDIFSASFISITKRYFRKSRPTTASGALPPEYADENGKPRFHNWLNFFSAAEPIDYD